MTQELQELLERIRKEGVDKARIEADAMLATARQSAEALLAKAAAEAEAARQAAERDAEAFGRRGEQSVRQAARDVLREVRGALDEQLDRRTVLSNEAVASRRCSQFSDREHIESGVDRVLEAIQSGRD